MRPCDSPHPSPKRSVSTPAWDSPLLADLVDQVENWTQQDLNRFVLTMLLGHQQESALMADCVRMLRERVNDFEERVLELESRRSRLSLVSTGVRHEIEALRRIQAP